MSSPFDIAGRIQLPNAFTGTWPGAQPGVPLRGPDVLPPSAGALAALMAPRGSAAASVFGANQLSQLLQQQQLLLAVMQWMQGGGCGGNACCNRLGQGLQSECRSCCGGGCPCAGAAPAWLQGAYQRPMNASACNQMLGCAALCSGGGCPSCCASSCAQAGQWFAANGFNPACTTGPWGGALPACWGGLCQTMNQPGGCSAQGYWNAWSQVLGGRM